tara:strand:- start:102 stop:782 length:681 start_codon:yes stop_codon:yes gene_type:complete
MKNEVLIIGHSPSPSGKKLTPTIRRLNKLFDPIPYRIYNLNSEPTVYLDYSKIKRKGLTRVVNRALKNGNPVVSMGREVDNYLNGVGIPHYPIPHPSPVNRQWNDKKFEESVIRDLQDNLITVQFKNELNMDFVMKYSEDRILKEFEEYIQSTYDKHYSKNNFQATEFIIDSGHGMGFCLGNVMKYAQRYGKKGGRNRADLMKIAHYAIMAMHVHDLEEDNMNASE